MSVKIIYFVHGTTTDNEAGRSTGWADGELSEKGINQAKELKNLVEEKNFSVIFCSDLQRAVDSAHLAFGDYQIIQDERLRECNYGDLSQATENLVKYSEHIIVPFPQGESLKNVEERIGEFVDFLKMNYDNKFIAIMAHKAPQLALEVILNGKTWEQALSEDWRHKKAWQPGWIYKIV